MHVSLSPCVGICRLDDVTGYCVGCGRTGDEIATWSTAGPSGRRAIWAALPARLQGLGVGVRRLPWTAADVRAFVLRTLREGNGAWLLAAPGAAASFPCPAPAGCEIRGYGETVEAIGADAALSLRCGADVRAFALDGTGAGTSAGAGAGVNAGANAGAGAGERIALAVQANWPNAERPPMGTAPLRDAGAPREGARTMPLRLVDADEHGAWWGVRDAQATDARQPQPAAQAPQARAPAAARLPAPADVLADARADAGAYLVADAAVGARDGAHPGAGGDGLPCGGDVVIATPLGRIEAPSALARFGLDADPGLAAPDGFPDGFIIAAIYQPGQ